MVDFFNFFVCPVGERYLQRTGCTFLVSQDTAECEYAVASGPLLAISSPRRPLSFGESRQEQALSQYYAAVLHYSRNALRSRRESADDNDYVVDGRLRRPYSTGRMPQLGRVATASGWHCRCLQHVGTHQHFLTERRFGNRGLAYWLHQHWLYQASSSARNFQHLVDVPTYTQQRISRLPFQVFGIETVRRVLAVHPAGNGEEEGDSNTLGHWHRRLCG